MLVFYWKIVKKRSEDIAQTKIAAPFKSKKSLRNTPQASRQQVTYAERKFALLTHAAIYQQGQMVSTVKNHVEHILAKLSVSDRTQAAVRAIELGLLHATSRH